jgi:hypothetical protein
MKLKIGKVKITMSKNNIRVACLALGMMISTYALYAFAQADAKPVRVYFIHDPDGETGKKWLTQTKVGTNAWGTRDVAEVWTKRSEATKNLKLMAGKRAKRSEIKAFITIPASDDS